MPMPKGLAGGFCGNRSDAREMVRAINSKLSYFQRIRRANVLRTIFVSFSASSPAFEVFADA